jgi:hypothetical protein
VKKGAAWKKGHCWLVFGGFSLMKMRRKNFNLALAAAYLLPAQSTVSSRALKVCRQFQLAMLAGGWDGAPPGAAPGFPRDGTWTVRAEVINRLP